MQLNDIHETHDDASVSMKVILLVFALVLVGSLGYLVMKENRTGTDVDTSPIVKKTDVTKDWKIYSSPAFGLTVKHPNNFTVTECADQCPDSADPNITIDETGEDFSKATFWIYIHARHTSLDQAVDSYKNAPAGIEYIVKEVTVDGYSARELYYNIRENEVEDGGIATPLSNVIILANGKVYDFKSLNNFTSENQKTFKEIIKSFDLK